MNDTGWGNYALAVFMFLTWPLWKPENRDMQAVQGFTPLPAGLSPCATEDQLHQRKLARNGLA